MSRSAGAGDPGRWQPQGEAAQSGNVEDLLHRDGTADQPHHGRKGLREDTGQRAPRRVPGDVVGCVAVDVPGSGPRFVEGCGQRLVEQTADHRSRRHPEGERGQRREDGDTDGVAPPVQPSSGAEVQGAGAGQCGDGDGDDERAEHQRDRDREGSRHLGQHHLTGHPGSARVALRQSAQPVHEMAERSLVQAQLFSYGGQLGGRGVRVGGAGPQDRQRGVVPGQPGQHGQAVRSAAPAVRRPRPARHRTGRPRYRPT